jgi:hypothetical protein
MGEIQNRPFQLSFHASLKVGLQGSRVTSDGGLILVRELDERLGFGELIAQHLTDPGGKNAQLGFADLPRQSVYSRLAGYEDLNDAERLSQDPTFRLISSDVRREPSDAAPVRKYAAAHRGSAATSRVGAAGRRNQSGRRRGVEGDVSEKALRMGQIMAFWAWAEDPRGRKGALPLERMRKRWRAGHSGVYSFVVGQAKWKSRRSSCFKSSFVTIGMRPRELSIKGSPECSRPLKRRCIEWRNE